MDMDDWSTEVHMLATLVPRLDALRVRYAEPHRFYHGQPHIDALLADFHRLDGMFAQPAAVELAIWYHDAIYDPAATDNELRSAALLRSELEGTLAEPLVERAEQLVLFTASHSLPPGLSADFAMDAELFLDLDMGILGAEPERFDAFEAGVEAEYVPVFGLARYRLGRVEFLRSVLGRARIFLSSYFHARLDRMARDNISRVLRSFPDTRR